ncbi:MAG: prolipoprotein diacylglyceryl transferase [Candidatus Omnitrophota bacterium]|nr:prolipoprotein diacylglyceryl transferase [Candidatus Omnitrophota bacterium]
MHPIIAKIGPLYVYSYGLMVAVGFAVATLLAYKHADDFKINKDRIIDLGIVMLVCGIIGARIVYIALNFQYYVKNPLEIINLTKGGLVWYGAFIFGMIGSAWFVKKNRISFWTAADLFAPYIALAQAFGRIGCLLNGCCYGAAAPSSLLLSVVFPDESILRYPTQVFSAVALLLIFVILRIWQKRRHFGGEIFIGYGLLYSVKRFGVEFFRGDYPKILYGLTISQLISAAVFAACLSLFIYRCLKWKSFLKSA